MSDNNLFFNSEEIRDLPLRTEFVTGPAGPTGNQGEAGAGITIGGITGQVLAKKSNANYDTEWVNRISVVSWGTIAGTLSNQTDLQNALNLKAPSTNIPVASITGLAVVATSGSYNDLFNRPNLAVVATSGSYSDLSNKPTYSDVGAAPSSGISPSAISGIAVITTDARLSNARTPTSHASTHAVGGSDPLTPLAIAAVGSNPTGITGADAVTNMVSLTQTEYNNIPTPDASTLYIITD